MHSTTEGFLYLEDEFGDAAKLATDNLALQFKAKGVRVAVLGACKTAQRDDINGWSAAADALVKAELGAVVGMQFPIRDDSAVQFADEFYKALVAGLTIDEAVTHGRIAIASASNDAPEDVRGWTTPVLHLRVADGVIFPEFTNTPETVDVREQIEVNVGQEVTLLKGKVTGVKINELQAGLLRIKQEIRTVEAGAEVVGAEIVTMGAGAVDVDQEADVVSGNVTGVTIGDLG